MCLAIKQGSTEESWIISTLIVVKVFPLLVARSNLKIIYSKTKRSSKCLMWNSRCNQFNLKNVGVIPDTRTWSDQLHLMKLLFTHLHRLRRSYSIFTPVAPPSSIKFKT